MYGQCAHGLIQAKEYKIGICCFSAKHTGAKIGWLGI